MNECSATPLHVEMLTGTGGWPAATPRRGVGGTFDTGKLHATTKDDTISRGFSLVVLDSEAMARAQKRRILPGITRASHLEGKTLRQRWISRT